jgi:7,8-dihydro-6-hydroxymethylpterin-pyrophosphokinase
MYERRFVLEPLAELAPELVDASMMASALGEVRVIGRL